MIDPKAYIESGKLEEYVLGLASTELAEEVVCMSRVFPEIKEEIKTLQLTFEKAATLGLVAPPAYLKQNILDAINLEEKEVSPTISSGKNTIADTSGRSVSKWLPLLGLLMLLSLALSFWFYTQNVKARQNLDRLQQEDQHAKRSIDSLNQSMIRLQTELDIIRHPNRMAIRMKGTALYPDGLATIYWSQADHQVYVSNNTLPPPPAGKQYQLWAIVDGKPVDLGVLNKNNSETIQQMKPIEHPSTFAVTLEQDGGSPSPTLDQMYVAGHVIGL